MSRRHSSSADFQLVGLDQDPTPGGPDLIQGVLKRYQDIGDAAEKALNVLKKDGTISTGRGSAMDRLKSKIGDDLPDKPTKTMNSYHDAAQAYTDYIPKLQQAQETFDQAVDQAEAALGQANQDQLGAAAGAVAGTAFKGLAGKAGSIRGNPKVAEGSPGRFGDTHDPAVGDTLGKRASDQIGGFVEEGSTLGAKIGVGVAQGGDPDTVAAGEIANSAPKLGSGPLGKAGLGRHLDGIPVKGSGHAALPTPAPTGPVEPADIPLPPSPTLENAPS